MGAVILGEEFDPTVREQLTDSKKLTAKQREKLNQFILTHASATGLGWVSATEIDQRGLSPALKLAARRATKQILAICKNQPLKFDEIVIDGTINLLEHTPLAPRVTLLKKADLLIKEVSAASIIAKVARDRYMAELSLQYPGYGFEKHVGYGTAAHTAALKTLGPCPEHRQSFRPIQALVSEPKPTRPAVKRANSTATGQQAERIVADYLTSQGHTLIARNYKTKTYEIDLISCCKQTVYFTEVKYRKTESRGGGLSSITAAKQAQMRYAATAFLAGHPELADFQPKLAAAAVTGPDFRLQTWLALD